MRSFLVVLLFSLTASASVTPADLEGHWLHEPYIRAMESSRSMLTAARAATPLTFTIAPDGDGYRMTVSTFHEASWHAISRIESTAPDSGVLVLGPYETPLAEASELTRVAFEVERDALGKVHGLRMTLWGEENAQFRRIDVPAEELVNQLLVAGTWRHLDGVRWVFDAQGTVLGPDGALRFTPSIDISEACCDYLRIGEELVGIERREDAIWMYRVIEDPEGCPISCDRTKPLRILVPDIPGDATSDSALSGGR